MLNQTRCKVSFRPGETILKQGTAMTHIAIISEGLVKIYLEGINKRKLILRIARSKTIIGGPGMYTDYMHHVTTMALEETQVCFIEVETINKIIEQNKEFAIGLLIWVNVHTISMYKKFIELTQKGMHGRISSALLFLYENVFKDQNGHIKINRQDLADLTAMSKESGIRILKEFKDENIISIDGNIIILNNINRLSEISLKG